VSLLSAIPVSSVGIVILCGRIIRGCAVLPGVDIRYHACSVFTVNKELIFQMLFCLKRENLLERHIAYNKHDTGYVGEGRATPKITLPHRPPLVCEKVNFIQKRNIKSENQNPAEKVKRRETRGNRPMLGHWSPCQRPASPAPLAGLATPTGSSARSSRGTTTFEA
jgi:hypothetical protein